MTETTICECTECPCPTIISTQNETGNRCGFCEEEHVSLEEILKRE